MSSGAGPSESICLANISPAYHCIWRIQRKYVTLSRALLVHSQCGPGRDEPMVLMVILFILAEDWTRDDENIPAHNQWELTGCYWSGHRWCSGLRSRLRLQLILQWLPRNRHLIWPWNHTWNIIADISPTSSRNPCFIIEAPAFSKAPECDPNPPSDRELCLTWTWATAHVLSRHTFLFFGVLLEQSTFNSLGL